MDFTGTGGINIVKGNVSIDNNNSLIDLNGFDSLRFIRGSLEIGRGMYVSAGIDYGNHSLVTVSGFSKLNRVRYLFISSNPKLKTLDGLSSLSEIISAMNINNNASLQDINSLEYLTTLGGSVHIHHNSSLLNLNGLTGLISINKNLSIYHNSSLTDITGLNNLKYIRDELEIKNNFLLTDAKAWDLVTIIGAENISNIIIRGNQ